MPNVIRITTPFIVNGNPDTMAVSLDTSANLVGQHIPYAKGDLGVSFDLNDKTYEVVVLDSGATSATPTGVVAANMLAFWKDYANRIVTNDRRMALGASVAQASCNFVAGVFRCAVATPGAGGTLLCVLTAGKNIPVKAGTVSGLGQMLIADVDANGPQALGVAVGTAPGYVSIGVSRGAAGGGNVNADVNIADLP